MNLWESILMGLIQGLTEFLPVSSSGHLAIFKILFHVNTETGILFDVLLHVGTLLAVVAVYYKDLWAMIKEGIGILVDLCANGWILLSGKEKKYRRIISNGYRKLDLLLVVSTIPTAIIGLAAEDFVEAAATILWIPGLCLLLTAGILFLCDRMPEGKKTPKDVSFTAAFGIGICQGLATLPGLSRSGVTITACLGCKMNRNLAMKYSFLMSIPAILGAAVLELKDIGSVAISGTEVVYYVIGMIIAALVGYVAIKTLLAILRKRKFWYFSIYCLAMGLLSIVGYFLI